MIQDNPDIGATPPFPWRPEVLEIVYEGFAIRYKIVEDVSAVISVAKLPDLSDLQLLI